MGIIKNFSKQFGKPEGFLGLFAGMLMATVGAEKNKWTISLLSIKKDDNVLEVGFGPGIGMELASKVSEEGKVVGIDYSEKMLQQARKRNKQAVQEGKVELMLADVQNLPSFNLRFDKVFSINSIIFWENPVDSLKGIRKLMKENGMLAITVQPFTKGATEDTTKQIGREIMNQMQEAGFSDIKMELKYIKPVSTVCVLGINK